MPSANLRSETRVLQDGRQHDGEEVLSAIVDRLHQDLVSAPFKVTGRSLGNGSPSLFHFGRLSLDIKSTGGL